MLFQMHLVLEDSPRAVLLEAFDDIEDALLPSDNLVGASNQIRELGKPVGFWSITDADEDPRIARVRQIAENLLSPIVRPGDEVLVGFDDIARALLAAIDGNPEPLKEATPDGA